MASYRAVDDDTVEFTFKKPSAPFLNSLAMAWNGLVSPAAAAKWGKDYRNHPVGSGPFVLKEWRQRDQIILDANPDYWGGKPKVDHLIFKELPDPQAAVLALKRSEIQILGDVSTQSVPAIKGDPNITLLTQPGLAVSGVSLPVDTPPFNDKRVRQALNYAVDKEAIDKALFAGLAVPLTSPLPQAQWGFDKSLPGYPYDPAKAKALLAEAGVKPGTQRRTRHLQFAARLQPGRPEPGDRHPGLSRQGRHHGQCETIRGRSLFHAGAIRQVYRDDDGGLDRRQRRSRQLPGRTLELQEFPDGRLVALQQPRSREAAGRRRWSKPIRPSAPPIYEQVQKTVLDDAPWIFLNSTLQIRAIRKNVKGFMLNPTQMFFGMENVSVE